MAGRWVAFILGAMAVGTGHSFAEGAPASDFIHIEQREFGPMSTGYIPADEETYASAPLTPTFRSFLPYSADLSSRFPEPGNQGQMGSCVAWAVGYAARSYYAHAAEHRPRGLAHHIPSPAYIYHTGREAANCDEGMSITSALSILKDGAPSLAHAPYSDTACFRPPPALRDAAHDFQIDGWRRVDTRNLDQIKAELAKENPVIFAISETPRSFDRIRGNTVWRWRGESEEARSGHAMTFVGYDDKRQAFRLINSWGRSWGDRGYAWMSYETASKLVREAYVMDVPSRPIPVPEPRPDLTTPEGLVELQELRCSSITVSMSGPKPSLSGFVGFPEDLERVQAAAMAADANTEVELRPWPQCEALLTLSDHLGRDGSPAVSISGGKRELAKGELLSLDITTPGHPTYLYLSYIQADGTVVNLHQPHGLVASQLPAYTDLRFGDGEEGRPRYTVSEPFGDEMVIAIASASPLFDVPLPRTQTEREYLTAMRTALYATPAPGTPPRVASGTVVTLETSEEATR